jgi:uncharacterized membrane protein YtjA (UPF0391 family)
MLGWAITFLVLALVAAYLGFFTFAGAAAMAAKVVLAVFLVLLALSVAAGRFGRRSSD